ncbi:alpha/beta-hydrolase [Aspergillus similis]
MATQSPASSTFTVTEHVIEASHIREYARATKPSNEVLKLVVKQYSPKSNPDPQPGDLTIIGTHGSGYPKELYEPIWEELYYELSSHGIRIRSIWIADTANQNASGVVNEAVIGDDPSWFDHARDLLYMTNQFKFDMPQPIVGIGHSFGAGQLVMLSLLHPRLFTSLILIEPVIEKDIYAGMGPELVRYSLSRENSWSSPAEAEAHFRKLFKKWDARVLTRWMEHGLRRMSKSAAAGTEVAVTLTTHPYQEVNQYLRPNFDRKKPASGDVTHIDIIGPDHTTAPFYRTEPVLLWKLLGNIRPPVLYLFGKASPLSGPVSRKEKLERTGRGIGGSGGYKMGRVKGVAIEGATHQLPFEKVGRIASESARWLKIEIELWKEKEESIRHSWEVEDGVGDGSHRHSIVE